MNKWDARMKQIEAENEARQRAIDANQRLQRAILMGIAATMLFTIVLLIWAAIQ